MSRSEEVSAQFKRHLWVVVFVSVVVVSPGDAVTFDLLMDAQRWPWKQTELLLLFTSPIRGVRSRSAAPRFLCNETGDKTERRRTGTDPTRVRKNDPGARKLISVDTGEGRSTVRSVWGKLHPAGNKLIILRRGEQRVLTVQQVLVLVLVSLHRTSCWSSGLQHKHSVQPNNPPLITSHRFLQNLFSLPVLIRPADQLQLTEVTETNRLVYLYPKTSPTLGVSSWPESEPRSDPSASSPPEPPDWSSPGHWHRPAVQEDRDELDKNKNWNRSHRIILKQQTSYKKL